MSHAVSSTAVRAVVVPAGRSPAVRARVAAVSARVSTPVRLSRKTARLGGSVVARAGEDDDAPAEPAAAPTPEPLSFPELSDDEEVKGAQMTAIITGASPARATNRRSLALSIRSTHCTPRITPPGFPPPAS